MAELNEENKAVCTTWMVVQRIHGWLNSTDEASGLPKPRISVCFDLGISALEIYF